MSYPLLSYTQPVITTAVQVDSLIQNQGNQGRAQRIRQGNKASKNIPAVDKTAFELECLKKQLNIAQTKIVELETELETAKNTNTILGERIKLFEDTNAKELFEKYFPRNDNNRNTDQSNSSRPSACDGCHHRCAPPPCPAFSCYAPHRDTNHTAAISGLSEKVSKLGDEISSIRNEVARLLKDLAPNACMPRQDILLTPSSTSCDNQDIQHDMSATEDTETAQELNNTPLSETNTIDDDVPRNIPLNCQALTT